MALIIIAGIVVVALIVLIVVLIVRSKKKKKALKQASQQQMNYSQSSSTMMLGAEGTQQTQMLFGGGPVAQNVPVSKRLSLVCTTDSVQSYSIDIVDSVVIGREPSMCNLAINDTSVSGRHCEVSIQNGSVYITDVGSSNGTKVDGTSLEKNVKHEVSNGAIVHLGRLDYKLTVE